MIFSWGALALKLGTLPAVAIAVAIAGPLAAPGPPMFELLKWLLLLVLRIGFAKTSNWKTALESVVRWDPRPWTGVAGVAVTVELVPVAVEGGLDGPADAPKIEFKGIPEPDPVMPVAEEVDLRRTGAAFALEVNVANLRSGSLTTVVFF